MDNQETANICVLPKVSIVMPTFNRAAQVTKAVQSVLKQTFTNWVLYIIGDKCPVLDSLMQKSFAHDSRIQWYNLQKNSGEGSLPRNYALKNLVTTNLVYYLDDDNTLEPNHIESLYTALKTGFTFAFSSFSFAHKNIRVLCSQPIKYRIQTSCVMHHMSLVTKYGFWRRTAECGYDVGWDLVSRWVKGNEPWQATKIFTCITGGDLTLITNAYDDQHEKIAFLTLEHPLSVT